MHLQPHPVDGDALPLETLHEIVDEVRLAPSPLGLVVVVEEERIRVGLAGRPEGVGDVPGAEAAQENRVAQSGAVGSDRLVHHVPRGHVASIVARDRANVVGHGVIEVAGRQGVDPGRGGAVPHQGVALDP